MRPTLLLKTQNILFFAFVLFFITCSEGRGRDGFSEGFYVTGNFVLQDSVKGILVALDGFRKFEIDSFDIPPKGFKFFKKRTKEKDNVAYQFSIPELNYSTNLFISNGDSIVLQSNDSFLKNVKISGSKLQEEMSQYFSSFDALRQQMDSVEKNINYYQSSGRFSSVFLQNLIDTHYFFEKKMNQIDSTYIVDHLNSKTIPFILFNKYVSHNNDINVIKPFISKISKENQKSFYLNLIHFIENNKLLVGNQFTMKEVFSHYDGKKIRLDSLNSPYILIHFWASWCKPCVAEFPTLLSTYNKFHPKGFEIISVSLDLKKEEWDNMIKKNKIPWINIVDFTGWKQEILAQYFITNIPANILLDSEYNILAINVFGKDLDAILKEKI